MIHPVTSTVYPSVVETSAKCSLLKQFLVRFDTENLQLPKGLKGIF